MRTFLKSNQFNCSKRYNPTGDDYSQYDGFVHGGGLYLLGVQALAVLVLSVWAATVTFIMLYVSKVMNGTSNA